MDPAGGRGYPQYSAAQQQSNAGYTLQGGLHGFGAGHNLQSALGGRPGLAGMQTSAAPQQAANQGRYGATLVQQLGQYAGQNRAAVHNQLLLQNLGPNAVGARGLGQMQLPRGAPGRVGLDQVPAANVGLGQGGPALQRQASRVQANLNLAGIGSQNLRNLGIGNLQNNIGGLGGMPAQRNHGIMQPGLMGPQANQGYNAPQQDALLAMINQKQRMPDANRGFGAQNALFNPATQLANAKLPNGQPAGDMDQPAFDANDFPSLTAGARQADSVLAGLGGLPAQAQQPYGQQLNHGGGAGGGGAANALLQQQDNMSSFAAATFRNQQPNRPHQLDRMMQAQQQLRQMGPNNMAALQQQQQQHHLAMQQPGMQGKLGLAKLQAQAGKGAAQLAAANTPRADEYGLRGLLSVIRMTDENLTMLALGTDLTTLGLNLNATETLYKTFVSPWSETPGAVEPDGYTLPTCYRFTPKRLEPGWLAKFGQETLFYVFYACAGSELQLLAGDELVVRGWYFHKEQKIWLTRVPHTQPLIKTARFERGSYYIFDTSTWEIVRKDNFQVAYDALEKAPSLPRSAGGSVAG